MVTMSSDNECYKSSSLPNKFEVRTPQIKMTHFEAPCHAEVTKKPK